MSACSGSPSRAAGARASSTRSASTAGLRTGTTRSRCTASRLSSTRSARPYLAGSEIDFVDALMGAGFAINNPNVQAACGCGSSFQAKDEAGGEPAHAHAAADGCGSGCSH